MRRLWPWGVELPDPTPTLYGDITKAVALGLWPDESSLRRTAAILSSGIPCEQPLHVRVQLESPGECAFSLDHEDRKFKKRVIIDPNGVEVQSDLYFLQPHLTGTGLGKRMFRNSLVLYDEWKVSFVSATANYGNGGYTWAKMAARPLDPDQVRAELLTLLDGGAFDHLIAKADQIDLRRLIEVAPDESLMYDVARSATAAGDPVGKHLLVGFRWEAFWDLNDNAQRALVAGALK